MSPPKIQFLIPPTFATFSPTNLENPKVGDIDIVAQRQGNSVRVTSRISGTFLHVSPSSSRASRLLKSVSRHFLSPIHGFTHSVLQKQEYADRVDLFVNAVPGPAGQVVCAFVLSEDDLEMLRLCMDPEGGEGGVEDGQDTALDAFRKRLMHLFELECNGEKSMNAKTIAAGYGFASTQTDVDGFFDLQLCWSSSSSHLNLMSSKRECHVAVFTATKANNGEEIDHFQLLSLPLLEKYPTERHLCVISDIDDTIKETKVYKGLLKTLKTSLLEPLEQVPGMSELFNTLLTNSSTATSASATQSSSPSSSSSAPSTTTFHYVSAGPTLFQPPIIQFLTQNNFPTTSLCLRRRPRAKKPQSTLLYKTEVIVDLLQRLGINGGGGKREFLLVGDEGEVDALVYKNIVEWAVAERLKSGHGGGIDIKGIFIRKLPSKCKSTAADTIEADVDGYGKDHLDEEEEERVELKFEDSVEADDGDERKEQSSSIVPSGHGPEVRFFKNGFDLAEQLSILF